MKITLLGLEFFIGNLGCEALSFSFLEILNDIEKNFDDIFEIEAFVFSDKKKRYEELQHKVNFVHIKPKSLNFWKLCKQKFSESDIIFDFTMGDSFSDIYGQKRFLTNAFVKLLAVYSKTPYVLGPQTYGPYKRKLSKTIAKHIINKSTEVFTRDEISAKYVKEITARDIKLTTDVAFILPYHINKQEDNRIKIGINPSGLLWKGGYTGDNQFNLKVDYEKYLISIIEEYYSKPNYKVYLIPHVGTETHGGVENDFTICCSLKEKYKELDILSPIRTPMDAKSFISQMDIFIGARMHATIAAFSSGVATIPFSYSRKFEGLYNSLEYPYTINATTIDTKEAIKITEEYIEKFKELAETSERSMIKVRVLNLEFKNSIFNLIKKYSK